MGRTVEMIDARRNLALKMKAEKKSRLKKMEVTCTEIQLKKAKQLYYAHEIGVDVTYKDYQRWHLL